MKKYKLNIILLVILSFFIIFISLKDNFNESVNVLKNINIIYIMISLVFVILQYNITTV